jgi:hypothetical protein
VKISVPSPDADARPNRPGPLGTETPAPARLRRRRAARLKRPPPAAPPRRTTCIAVAPDLIFTALTYGTKDTLRAIGSAQVSAHLVRTAPMGTPAVKGACWVGPVSWSRASGWDGTVVVLSSWLPGLRRRAVRGQTGARPQRRAFRRGRGRTSSMPASGGRSWGARKSPPCAGVVVQKVAGLLSPGGSRVAGVVSHAPIRLLPGRTGAMTVLSADRAAQTGHRARRGRARAMMRARPGAGDPSR